MTSRTEQLVGAVIALAGVAVLGAAPALTDGTLTWLLASSAVVLVLCGAGLVLDARARAGRAGPTPHQDR
ncbi:MAG TPA: hypothetical protein VGP36_12500 [Mycobacteriales bacterium]|nr:hypothetical protein [Mycobacteriales bacterium]